MNAEQDEYSGPEYEESTGEPLSTRAARALRRRWVQVVLALFFGAAAIGVSAAVLKPKTVKVANPKYLRCPKCDYETKYVEAREQAECMNCRDEPVGKLEPQEVSIKDQLGKKSPWRWFHMAAALEGILTVGVVLYLLKRPMKDPANTYYVFSCPYCSQRLRFRHVSLGGLGQCSRCKRPVRFPNEANAMLEDDLIREEQERAEAEEGDEENEDEE